MKYLKIDTHYSEDPKYIELKKKYDELETQLLDIKEEMDDMRAANGCLSIIELSQIEYMREHYYSCGTIIDSEYIDAAKERLENVRKKYPHLVPKIVEKI